VDASQPAGLDESGTKLSVRNYPKHTPEVPHANEPYGVATFAAWLACRPHVYGERGVILVGRGERKHLGVGDYEVMVFAELKFVAADIACDDDVTGHLLAYPRVLGWVSGQRFRIHTVTQHSDHCTRVVNRS
jgi:hypothetical protein